MCQKSCNKLKDTLCSQPVLNIFYSPFSINIYSDDSILSLGAVLKQFLANGQEIPVVYIPGIYRLEIEFYKKMKNGIIFFVKKYIKTAISSFGFKKTYF